MTDKQNFEKDINVPSKRRIMDDYNAKDCEQCSSDTVCCNCQNLAWYKLKEQLQAKEQECEELKQFLSKEPLAIQALQSAYSDYKKSSEVFFEMIGEYKQTLTEIKEIAEAESYLSPQSTRLLVHKILQKISECEGNDEKH